MEPIKFNCIFILISENCKLIHLGNSTHRSTDILPSPTKGSPQLPVARRAPRLKVPGTSRLSIWPSLTTFPSSHVVRSVTPGWTISLLKVWQDWALWCRTEMVRSLPRTATGCRLLSRRELLFRDNYISKKKRELLPALLFLKTQHLLGAFKFSLASVICVYFPKFCQKMICFFKSLPLFELFISDVDIFYIGI